MLNANIPVLYAARVAYDTVTTRLFECRSIAPEFISACRWLLQVRKLTLTPPQLRWRESGQMIFR